MAVQTPLVLVDNVFDGVTLYPGAVLDAVSELVGREAVHATDYRRDRSYWSPLTDGGGSDTWIRQHLLAARAVDYVFLDRGHNLAGKTIYLEGGTDGSTWVTSIPLNVPAAGVVGGTPTVPSMAQTEEGAAWSLLSATGALSWWRLRVPYAAGFLPQVTGIMAGLRTQLLGYSDVYDEDAGGRKMITQESTAGYRAMDTVYSWRTVDLGFRLIGATEYDSTLRTVFRDTLFAKNQPAVVFMDYGTYPERGWMYQYDGTDWSMAKQRVHRNGRIRMREVSPRLG